MSLAPAGEGVTTSDDLTTTAAAAAEEEEEREEEEGLVWRPGGFSQVSQCRQ